MLSWILTGQKCMFAQLARFEKSILKWIIAVLLLAIPLYPKFPIFNIPGTYVAIRAEDFLVVITGLFLALEIIKNPKLFLGDRINQALLLFFAVGFFSVLAGVFLTQTVTTHLGFLHWMRRIEYVIPFFAAALLTRSDFPKFIPQVLMIAASLVFVYALGQIYLGWPVISTQNLEFSKGLALQWIPGARLHSTFAGHYDLAAFLVIVLPIFWAYLFAVKNKFQQLIVFFVIGCSFWLLLISSSRISIAAYFISVGLTLWLLRKRIFILPVFFLSLLLMFSMGDLLSRYTYSINAIKQRIDKVLEQNKPSSLLLISLVWAESDSAAPVRKSSTKQGSESTPVIEDRSTEIRFNVEWPRAVRALSKNPLLGTGYSSITLATDNDYLRILGETGMLGFLAFALILLRITKRLLGAIQKCTDKLTFECAFMVGAIGSFAGILVNATFIDVFEASKVALVFWTVLGVSVAIANGMRIQKS